MALPFWREIFWASYLTWAAFELWVASRDRRAAKGDRQDRGSLFFLVAMIVAGIFTMFSAPAYVPRLHIVLPGPALFIVALVLIWGGMVFRLWAIRTLGHFFRTTVLLHDGHRLVSEGPYRLLRHPAYAGSLITIIGFGLFLNNWVSLLGALGFILIGYGYRIQVEEKALGTRFGETFRAQQARSWALIPYVW
jgi:protein-S-isoprenylcysteine O-methyltransferase